MTGRPPARSRIACADRPTSLTGRGRSKSSSRPSSSSHCSPTRSNPNGRRVASDASFDGLMLARTTVTDGSDAAHSSAVASSARAQPRRRNAGSTP